MFDKFMTKLATFIDWSATKLALLSVIATFAGVPLALWLYDSVYLPSQEPADAKVFTLYWSGTQGISQKRINGTNYWRTEFDKLEKGDLQVNQGDRVVFRLISADVHHGFAMPAFGLGIADTILIKPGDITRVEFVADKVSPPEGFRFFCTIMCGKKEIHDKMEGFLDVLPANTNSVASADAKVEVERSAAVPTATNLDGVSLIDRDAETFRFDSLRGRVWVASFFFTSCPSGCLKMNREIAKLQHEFGEHDVKFVSITCDPETDTPEILKTYSESFQADAKRWVFLTGDLERILDIGSGSFKLPIAAKTHSTHLVLVDRHGMIRDTYRALDAEHITRLKRQLAKVLAEGVEPVATPPAPSVSARDQGWADGKL
ncbi:MAG: SCO family protein [Pirellulaceae bacterium]|jgi:cytochrome oxidase Cu insertion factor (SCO1/SenC/PrrC family)|nr:SCO family protein [Pirellulaceae bacterium]